MAQDIEDLHWSGSPLQVGFCNFPTGRSACLRAYDTFLSFERAPYSGVFFATEWFLHLERARVPAKHRSRGFQDRHNDT